MPIFTIKRVNICNTGLYLQIGGYLEVDYWLCSVPLQLKLLKLLPWSNLWDRRKKMDEIRIVLFATNGMAIWFYNFTKSHSQHIRL